MVPAWNECSELLKDYGQTQQQIKDFIFGPSFDSQLFRYGALLMQNIFDTAVTNGVVYGEPSPFYITKSLLMGNLVCAGISSLCKD